MSNHLKNAESNNNENLVHEILQIFQTVSTQSTADLALHRSFQLYIICCFWCYMQSKIKIFMS